MATVSMVRPYQKHEHCSIQIELSRELYRELLIACRRSSPDIEPGDPVTPEAFCKECVEAVLAERRLDRMEMEAYT